jgi:hypothetical protein
LQCGEHDITRQQRRLYGILDKVLTEENLKKHTDTKAIFADMLAGDDGDVWLSLFRAV